MARCLDRLVGHDKQVAQLESALKRQRLAMTLLFVGPSGVGKKLCAQGVAQALICTENPLGCGQCASCRRIEQNQSESVLYVEPEGLQIKMEQARQIIRFISVRGLGQARVVIIDRADLMNPQAANSLLKSLEEPPEDTYFILIANSVSGILPTIRSRSQVLRFGALSTSQLRRVSSADDWIIEAAQGRADVAMQLEQMTEFRDQALGVWRQWLVQRNHSVVNALNDPLKDKEKTLMLTRLWQQLIRDVHFMKKGQSGFIHGDHLGLIRELGEALDGRVGWVGQLVLDLEKSILSNAERSLAFEDFFIQLEGTAN